MRFLFIFLVFQVGFLIKLSAISQISTIKSIPNIAHAVQTGIYRAQTAPEIKVSSTPLEEIDKKLSDLNKIMAILKGDFTKAHDMLNMFLILLMNNQGLEIATEIVVLQSERDLRQIKAEYHQNKVAFDDNSAEAAVAEKLNYVESLQNKYWYSKEIMIQMYDEDLIGLRQRIPELNTHILGDAFGVITDKSKTFYQSLYKETEKEINSQRTIVNNLYAAVFKSEYERFELQSQQEEKSNKFRESRKKLSLAMSRFRKMDLDMARINEIIDEDQKHINEEQNAIDAKESQLEYHKAIMLENQNRLAQHKPILEAIKQEIVKIVPEVGSIANEFQQFLKDNETADILLVKKKEEIQEKRKEYNAAKEKLWLLEHHLEDYKDIANAKVGDRSIFTKILTRHRDQLSEVNNKIIEAQKNRNQYVVQQRDVVGKYQEIITALKKKQDEIANKKAEISNKISSLEAIIPNFQKTLTEKQRTLESYRKVTTGGYTGIFQKEYGALEPTQHWIKETSDQILDLEAQKSELINAPIFKTKLEQILAPMKTSFVSWKQVA